jgi:hypothetical protein
MKKMCISAKINLVVDFLTIIIYNKNVSAYIIRTGSPDDVERVL